jgi:multiple sugar transport system ATP-binding protein
MLDEPLGALDAEFREVMCGELRALHDRLGATTVYVTHDQLEAMTMADTIALMNAGRLEQIGPPQEIYDRPVSVFVADFIGSPPMNFLPFHGPLPAGTRSVRLAGAEVTVPETRQGAAEGDLLLGVRPEHVRLGDSGPLRAAVLDAEYLGATQIVALETAGGARLRARVPSEVPAHPGDQVSLTFRTDRLSVFDRPTGRALRSALHEEPLRG